MKYNTGGPAFPIDSGMTAPNGHSGMTLRDYFATHASDEDVALAMGRIKDIEIVLEAPDGFRKVMRSKPPNARQIARYIHADAMLAERDK